MSSCNAARSPMEVNLKLLRDESEKGIYETEFKQIIGSLWFLCNSRPELAFCLGLISRFMGSSKRSHLLTAKRVLRYVQGTIDHGILFAIGKQKFELESVGYTDTDHGGDLVERKSTFGFVFLLNKALASWCSKKQPVIALSNCEAEYIAGSFATCQCVWLEELLMELR
ncbi:hypothetical protein VIGAN_06125700, partial [Vigna angularis var. angularis]